MIYETNVKAIVDAEAGIGRRSAEELSVVVSEANELPLVVVTSACELANSKASGTSLNVTREGLTSGKLPTNSLALPRHQSTVAVSIGSILTRRWVATV